MVACEMQLLACFHGSLLAPLGSSQLQALEEQVDRMPARVVQALVV